ncbi:SixA phosphatase family protein [Spongiimicrobium sp. 2-473A-2-J]|uniref:SixA phosphatase family protein n=1 Tax=Eudoraea algarum TaxID=3417568 RepID=UPI003D35B753
MKRLILVRHGKSSWEYQVNDKDRPLKERGIRDGHLVLSEFKSLGVLPDAIFSSPANRALHTCMIFLRGLDFPFTSFQLTDFLYDFSGESVFTFVTNLDDTLDTVMLFGHNYAFTNVANTYGSTSIDNVPTSGLVQINFNIDHWKDADKGITKHTLFPKQLR